MSDTIMQKTEGMLKVYKQDREIEMEKVVDVIATIVLTLNTAGLLLDEDWVDGLMVRLGYTLEHKGEDPNEK